MDRVAYTHGRAGMQGTAFAKGRGPLTAIVILGAAVWADGPSPTLTRRTLAAPYMGPRRSTPDMGALWSPDEGALHSFPAKTAVSP